MIPPVARSMTDGQIRTDTMDDTEYAFAISELQEGLPPDTMAWIKKVIAEAKRVSTPNFRSFAINDPLDQAPSAEQLLAANSPGITAKNVNEYAVSVVKDSLKASYLSCKNGSRVTFEFTEANKAYWERNPEHQAAKVRVETGDGRDFMYLRFNDGSERLTVELPDYGDHEQTRASLREAGATLIEKTEDFAHGAAVRNGVQAPNDATLGLMSAALKAAVESGVKSR